MKIMQCERCGDNEREVHMRAMDEFHEQFAKEHRAALKEYKRLYALWNDVIWYNFETTARHWKAPWPETFAGSSLELHAHRYGIKYVNGRQCDSESHPYYYKGTVSEAPVLPPEVIRLELDAARKDVKAAADLCAAPYEWAPGGDKYQEMLRESDGVKAYRELSSKHTASGDGRESPQTWPGLQLGDRLERQTKAATEPPTHHLLGRVCGDRSMVCE